MSAAHFFAIGSGRPGKGDPMAIMKRIAQVGLLTTAARMLQRQASKPGSRANSASSALTGALRKYAPKARTSV